MPRGGSWRLQGCRMMAVEVVSAVAAWLDRPLVHRSYFCPVLADLPVSHQL